jgi:hypothetical protein
MADPVADPADPFASAKANLRDTVKWLATAFAAVAGVVLAGASLTGVSQLKGTALDIALVGGFVGLLCIITAAGTLLRLLTADTFFVSDLRTADNARMKEFLDRHGADFLPAEILNIEDFLQKRDQAILQARQYSATPQSAQYQQASNFLAAIVQPLSRLTNLAQLEKLRRDLKRAEPLLFALAFGALIGLGFFAVFSPAPKDNKENPCESKCKKPDPAPPVAHGLPMNLVPGTKWSYLAASLAQACKDDPIEAEVLPTQPHVGWFNIRLTAKDCAGIVFPVPASQVIPTVTKP